jgi:hypothetical protein
LVELLMDSMAISNNLEVVRILEVRFHARGRSDDFVVVGQIICSDSRTFVEPAPDLDRLLGENSRASVVTNLRYLVLISRPRSFENLCTMDSRYWSFVRVCPDKETRMAENPRAPVSVGPTWSHASGR